MIPSSEFDKGLASADACAGRAGGVADKTNHLTPGGAKRQCSIRGEHMTISAQVIDTIVEWIDDNLHQPLRIDDIARHAGYSKWHLQRLFLQYKGESLGRYIRERKLLLAARDLRDTDQRVYDICLKYGFDSQQTFTRVFTRTFNLPAGRLP